MDYKAVGRGSLKLKGGPATKEGGVKKKKKRNISSDSIKTTTTNHKENTTTAKDTGDKTMTKDQEDTTEIDTRTPAQRKFDEIRRLREDKAAVQRAGLSHRERIEAMNTHLARLSEHNDMPKIGPG